MNALHYLLYVWVYKESLCSHLLTWYLQPEFQQDLNKPVMHSVLLWQIRIINNNNNQKKKKKKQQYASNEADWKSF